MTIHFINIFSMLFAVSSFSLAAVEFTGAPQQVSVSGITIPVYPTAKVDGEELKLTGYGTRAKQIFLGLKANVYVAASYSTQPLESTNPMESVKAAKAKVIQLTFVRNLTSDEIRTSFEEALDKNGVDLNATPIQNIFAQFAFSLKAGQTVTLTGTQNATGSMEKLVIEVPGKTAQEEGKELATDFWRIWLGIPVDAEMGELKKALVGKGN
jgi:hypothetical protein